MAPPPLNPGPFLGPAHYFAMAPRPTPASTCQQSWLAPAGRLLCTPLALQLGSLVRIPAGFLHNLLGVWASPSAAKCFATSSKMREEERETCLSQTGSVICTGRSPPHSSLAFLTNSEST